MYYKPDINLAFSSVEYIHREVYYGWLFRYAHMNGASFFFLVVYLHIIRNLVFGSYAHPRQLVWFSGCIILFLMICTAFMGYVLPWGQMSLWGATVITNIVTAIPFVGVDIVEWFWGGFSVDDATLNRFYSLHFFLPFVILGLSIVHVILLHEFGSNNPLGVSSKQDYVNFFPGYIVKDFTSWMVFFWIFCYFVFFDPNYFSHPDNYILGNSLVTPSHIVPEWYFLPLYAVLRSIPNKLLGLVVLILFLLCFFFLPWFTGAFMFSRSLFFKKILQSFIYLFIVNLIVLGWIGGKPVEDPYLFIGQVSTFLYFFLYVCFFLCNYIEYRFYAYYISWINKFKKN